MTQAELNLKAIMIAHKKLKRTKTDLSQDRYVLLAFEAALVAWIDRYIILVGIKEWRVKAVAVEATKKVGTHVMSRGDVVDLMTATGLEFMPELYSAGKALARVL